MHQIETNPEEFQEVSLEPKKPEIIINDLSYEGPETVMEEEAELLSQGTPIYTKDYEVVN